MARAGLRVVALASVFAPLAGLGAIPPRPAPPIYATGNYNLTFHPPRGSTYCPLPRGWVGSDHGTTLFLERPRDCGDAGYSSTSRGFTPDDVARIELFYAYANGDDPQAPHCRRAGFMTLLGHRRPLCRTERGGMISLSVATPYTASTSADVILTLRTRPSRLRGDLAAFGRLAATFRTCTATWSDDRGHRRRYGSGPACARSGWF